MNPAADTPDAAPEPVFELAGWRRVAVRFLGLLAQAWGRSLRFEIAPEDLCNITKSDEPLSIILWHNRLFLAAEIVRRYRRRPAYALVSASPDGAWLAAFFAAVGLRSVRGSSSHLGREAVAALVDKLRAGFDIGITPDGPRGPMYDFKGGAYIVTRRAGTPAMLLGGKFARGAAAKELGRLLPAPALFPGADQLPAGVGRRTARRGHDGGGAPGSPDGDQSGLRPPPSRARPISAILERGHGHSGATRLDDKVVPDAPGDVVQQEFENDRHGRIAQGDRPLVVRHAIHRQPPVPAQARALATDVEGVAKADVDLRRDFRACGFDRRLLERRRAGRSPGGAGRGRRSGLRGFVSFSCNLFHWSTLIFYFVS